MQGSDDVRTFTRGAELAEARGDHAAAEGLLRRALVLQEFSLGERHPEVANTLNNLAIVCEMNGKLSDAEACYRRAYAIATSILPPGDPFVSTSRANLEQFCAARGVPFRQTPPAIASSPASAPPAAPPPKAPAPPPQSARPEAKRPRATPPRMTSPAPPAPAAPRAPSAVPVPPRTSVSVPVMRERSLATAIVVALVALLSLVVAGWYLFDSSPPPDRAAPAAPSSPAPSSAPAPAPAPTEPADEIEPAAPPPAPEPVVPSPSPPATAPAPPAPTARASSVGVVSAQLCRSLSTGGAWRCTPAGDALRRGTMYFYTRVASPRDTTIEHRWYRDVRLHQRVPLRIRANPSGFRTYSRATINADRAGMWKVELRSQDGRLLHEETFAVK
jgi:hypothetical protein